MQALFATDDWILYNGRGPQAHDAIAALGLEPLTLGIRGATTLHIYGGGFFNHFWGQASLERLEQLLMLMAPRHYVISGQQVGPEIAPLLAEHCRTYQPELIGCRDRASVDTMRQYGIDAQLSGDDALEQMVDAAARPRTAKPAGQPAFALNLNSSPHVYTARTERESANPVPELKAVITCLAQRFGKTAVPLLLEAYPDPRAEVQDTLATAQRLNLRAVFPTCDELNLVDLLLDSRLDDAATTLRRCELAVSTSYHVALFCRVLGVPVYLLSLNEFYRQKSEGLGNVYNSLPDFLAADRARQREEAANFVLQQQEIRSHWLATLAETLAAPAQEARLVARANASLAGLRRQVDELDSGAAGQATVRAQERQHALEAQLHRLTNSTSWRITAPLRATAERWRRLRHGAVHG